MTNPMKRALLGLWLAAGWIGLAPAQEAFPSRTITMVVPFAPGGGVDILARIMSEPLRRSLGQVIAVQNVTGAGGLIGAQQVAQARPDGYTLLLHHIGMATIPALFPTQQFDPLTSFEPIGLLAEMPMVVVARPGFPANSMSELLAHARQHGDRVTIALVGLGSSTHLCAMLLQKATGITLTAVQFRGGAPALTEVQAGRVDLFCEATGVVVPSIRAGMIRPYALTGSQRVPSLPDVATVRELGITGLDMTVWFAAYAPANTPRPIVDRISAALRGAIEDPAVRAQLAQLEALPFPVAQANQDAHRAFLASQVRLWSATLQGVAAAAN